MFTLEEEERIQREEDTVYVIEQYGWRLVCGEWRYVGEEELFGD